MLWIVLWDLFWIIESSSHKLQTHTLKNDQPSCEGGLGRGGVCVCVCDAPPIKSP